MSGFKALNIESDDESDVEIDDTKEIQIEDALKLYQNALRLHAEGPGSFERAMTAYHALFESEIFRYPESQPELQRVELYGSESVNEELWLNTLHAHPVVPNSSLDSGPSTLPQILHLSHKNYAQFTLEYLTYKLHSLDVTLNQILSDAGVALDHFVKALDKDDTDLDLWRKTASVSNALDSVRVARFCLEAVLDGDGDALSDLWSLPGLEESLAAERLSMLIDRLSDYLSMLYNLTQSDKTRSLSNILKERLKLYEFIEQRASTLRLRPGIEDGKTVLPMQRAHAKIPTTWTEFGNALLHHISGEEHETYSGPSLPLSFHHETGTDTQDIHEPNRKSLIGAMELELATMFSDTIEQQFPGLDGGKPTVQPAIASAFPEKELQHLRHASSEHQNCSVTNITLPSRKRSGDTAGINESNEEGRTKSKRIRARDSNIDPETTRQALLDENARWEVQQRLDELQALDDWMFRAASKAFEKIGVTDLEASRLVREEFRANEDGIYAPTPDGSSVPDKLKPIRAELIGILQNFTDQTANVLIKDNQAIEVGPGLINPSQSRIFNSNSTAYSSSKEFATVPNEPLHVLLQRVLSGWFAIDEAAWEWLWALLGPDRDLPEESFYLQYRWPEDLKTIMVRVLLNFDEYFFRRANEEFEAIQRTRSSGKDLSSRSLEAFADAIQSIFELHLDIFTLIRQPNSGVEDETVANEGDRLQRWSGFAREVMFLRSCTVAYPVADDILRLRFLWATAFHIAVLPDITQDHVLICMAEIGDIFYQANSPVILLPNNAVMPELSNAALEQERSKLMTKDFFSKVTSPDLGDPVDVIQTLEPLLDHLDGLKADDDVSRRAKTRQPPPEASHELVQYLLTCQLSVKLMLWQRLQDAYVSIEYQPMVVSCHFRMLRLVLDEFGEPTFLTDLPANDRPFAVLRHLKMIITIVSTLLSAMQTSSNTLECMDEHDLRAAVSTIGQILQLLQVVNVCEDLIRVGKVKTPVQVNGLPSQSWTTITSQLHDMQVHVWIILYRLLQEAMAQNKDKYDTPSEDCFELLCAIHRNLGVRGICGSSKRAFVRMLKDEFLTMTHVEHYESEQAQVLYDIYGLNCFLNPATDLTEHNCQTDTTIDKAAAIQAVDLLLVQASKLPIKELVKHSLKDTIDKVHGSVSRKKPTEAILRNREIYRAFLKSPINRLDLFACLKGQGNELPVSPVPDSDALLAAKGWYFLMGHISLTKFRSQKRTTAAPTEDVDIAIAFFMQDLEYSMDNWETWFRLAQAYDTKIEESVVWSAEKLNNGMQEMVQLQRAAIHCYTMATALAHRSAALAFETSDKMSELYFEFANRIYASSREPFSMLPFAVDDDEKFLSAPTGLKKGMNFPPLRLYTAWKLAKVLYQRAATNHNHGWMLPYNLGKCLWKMHNANPMILGQDQPPSAQQVLDCIVRAIEAIPAEKKDGREKREPTLEPHYKLVAIVHKLISKNELTLEQAKEALTHTKYAAKVDFPASSIGWSTYLLAILKTLRTADKSNWHHRLVARATQIIYDNDTTRESAETTQTIESTEPSLIVETVDLTETSIVTRAQRAKHELTQQLFTKTMVLQVWRPESERAGRHFVYYARYTRFFVKILETLEDRASLEQLAKRVRRRSHDVFEHTLVWQDICGAYLRLLRRHGQVSEGLETATFSNIAHEDFLACKDGLEKWMQAQDSGVSPALDVLREVYEMKKINQSLMRLAAFDDLIGDAYALLFNTVGKRLWEEDKQAKQEAEDIKRLIPTASPPRHSMMSVVNLLTPDGTEDRPVSIPSLTNSPAGTVAVVHTASEAPVRGKNKVGRREIRVCAEACFQKATAIPHKDALKLPVISSRVQVVIKTSDTPTADDSSVPNSVPASVHDSGDEESELSELEETDADDEGGDEEEDDLMNDVDDGASKPESPLPAAKTTAVESKGAGHGFETVNETAVGEAETDADGTA